MSDTPQPPQEVVPQQQQQGQAPVAAPVIPTANSVGENLQCQWANCGERCSSAETLYEHVCERHVGRKSTNNLNLTCQWGACRTATVKRDHITSHIRVHVPLKPHKCEFCGKAFKRPQDLKKHVKTHADDSVIMRSPEPGSTQRPAGGAYNVGNEKGPSYYAQALNPGQEHNGGYHGAPTQYYQPQHTHQASQHPSYGPVTYYTNAPAAHAALNDYESRKRGFEALDHFFGEVKRRQFNPIDYQNVSQRLYELQGLQLPMITQQPVSAIPAYQPVSAMAGGYGGQGDPMQAYSLPPMGNAKTRGDLTSIDHILEQMQATIYESDNQIAQAGVAQPGAQYVAYRTSQSPPSVHLASDHANAMMNQGQTQHHGSIASATESAHSSTPALTPPSSAQSYTSGQSPIPGHALTPLQSHVTNAMYPTLPASSGLDYGVGSNVGAATLGGYYDGEEHRRRYSGGRLQRAQPARRNGNEDAMDVESEGSATPPASVKQPKGKGKKISPNSSVIDPALGGEPTKSPTSSSEKGVEMSKEDVERERDWVQNMRLIEWMREYVKKRLDSGEYDDDSPGSRSGKKGDVEMGGLDDSKKEANLYPSLKAE